MNSTLSLSAIPLTKIIDEKIDFCISKKIPFSIGHLYSCLKIEKAFDNLKLDEEITLAKVKSATQSHASLKTLLNSGNWRKTLYNYKFDVYHSSDFDISEYKIKSLSSIYSKMSFCIKKDVLNHIRSPNGSNTFYLYRDMKCRLVITNTPINVASPRNSLGTIQTNSRGHIEIKAGIFLEGSLRCDNLELYIDGVTRKNSFVKRIVLGNK